MPTIGKIKVDLEGDTRRFQRSMRGAKRQVDTFGNSVRAMGRSLALVSGALGFGVVIRRTTEEALRVKQLSDRLGTTVEGFSKLSRVLGRSGIRLDQTGVVLQRLQRRAAEAAAGNEQLGAVFEELGINVEDFVKLDPVEAFLQFGEALAKVDTNARKLLLGFKVLDTEGVQVLQTDLSKLRAELDATAGITDKQAEQITRAAEAWDKLKDSVSSALLEFGQSTGIFEQITKAFNALREFSESEQTLMAVNPGFQAGRAVRERLLAASRALGFGGEQVERPSFIGPVQVEKGASREIISLNLQRSNALLEQIRNNTSKPQPAVAQ